MRIIADVIGCQTVFRKRWTFTIHSPPVLTAASPITYITPDDPPFLIIHGDRDEVVPVEQSLVLDAQLKKAGVPSELVIVRNGTHGIYGENISPTGQEISDRVTAFLDEHLK